MKRKKKKGDVDESNWLVSYADLMTLLCCFFIVLTSFSSPDPQKFEKLRKYASRALGGKYENPYEILERDILDEVRKLGIDQSVELSTGTDGITLVAKDKSFFSSGSITMNPEASNFIENIGHLLSKQKFTFQIVVEGHTDDVPINHSLFPSNWELSLRRASEVVRTFERLGIPRTNLLPQGLADTKPVKDPTGLSGGELESARSSNRRIVIKLLKKI